MAENESLDLNDPGGQRWQQVRDAVKRQESPEEVAYIISRKLPAALRKAFKELEDHGVNLEQFLVNRHDPKAMARLVRKSQGHPYAHLLVCTAAAESSFSELELLSSFLTGAIDRVIDQINHEIVQLDDWPSYADANKYFEQVNSHLEPELRRIAAKLEKNPNWKPTASKKPNDKSVNPTEDLLKMSLIGMPKR